MAFIWSICCSSGCMTSCLSFFGRNCCRAMDSLGWSYCGLCAQLASPSDWHISPEGFSKRDFCACKSGPRPARAGWRASYLRLHLGSRPGLRREESLLNEVYYRLKVLARPLTRHRRLVERAKYLGTRILPSQQGNDELAGSLGQPRAAGKIGAGEMAALRHYLR